MSHPECFNSFDEYDQWQRLNRMSGEKVSICADCTHEYKNKMIKEGRCDQVAAMMIAKEYYCEKPKTLTEKVLSVLSDEWMTADDINGAIGNESSSRAIRFVLSRLVDSSLAEKRQRGYRDYVWRAAA